LNIGIGQGQLISTKEFLLYTVPFKKWIADFNQLLALRYVDNEEIDVPKTAYLKFADDTGVELRYKNLSVEEVKIIVLDFLRYIKRRMRPKNLYLNVGKTEIVSNDIRLVQITVEGQILPVKNMFRL
jgi:hypothetical protein